MPECSMPGRGAVIMRDGAVADRLCRTLCALDVAVTAQIARARIEIEGRTQVGLGVVPVEHRRRATGDRRHDP